VTISENNGTGIVNEWDLDVTNSVISNNTAQPNSIRGAAGIYNSLQGVVWLSNTTIISNTGIGIRTNLMPYGTVIARNTIVANNSAGNCVEANGLESTAFVSEGHNLESAATCNFVLSSDMPNNDPKLSPAVGAPIPLAGSPAIDAGDATNCPEVDRWGTPRPIDGNGDQIKTCDIGAFEVLPNAMYSNPI